MTTLPRDQLKADRRWQLCVAAVFGAVLVAYSGLGGLGGLADTVGLWVKKSDYSHGFLVVPFAAYLLWRNRGLMPEQVGWPNWSGLPLLLGPLPLYLADAELNVAKEWVQGGCLVASLAGVLVTFAAPPPGSPRAAVDHLGAGLCLSPLLYFCYYVIANGGHPVVFGVAVGLLGLGVLLTAIREWVAVRWAAPTLAMLLLALPLPATVETELSWQLRKVATVSALAVFRTFGLPTLRDADSPMVLDVDGVKLDVQAPCSGLSMLLAFVALAAAIVFLCPPSRRRIDRWAVFLSSLPIAVFCNIVRIVVSGLVLRAGWKPAFDLIVHDFAGWLMMPLALGLVWAEFKLIDWLLVPVQKMSREEVVKAGLAEAKAEIERQEAGRKAWQEGRPRTGSEPHPAAPFLPLTPAGTSHGATATGGTIAQQTDDTPAPPTRPGPGAGP